MEPGHREEYVAYLRSKEQWGQAAEELAKLVNDDSFRSIEGKSKHHLWLELCDIITTHPDDVRALNIDAIIRSGIRKFPTEVRLPVLRALPRLCCAAHAWSVGASSGAAVHRKAITCAPSQLGLSTLCFGFAQSDAAEQAPSGGAGRAPLVRARRLLHPAGHVRARARRVSGGRRGRHHRPRLLSRL